ncbi:MAG: YlxR family protein [Deltaproteobacteria bacterium]|nr:YlxR family protein [Deltaproteobacteria bacterium]
MCVICRGRRNKSGLIRFVFAEGTLPLEDARQILPGRGYYVCAQGACKEKWLRKAARFSRRAGKRG